MNPLFFLLALLGAGGLSSGGSGREQKQFISRLPDEPNTEEDEAEEETPPPAEDPPAEDPPAEDPPAEDPPADDGMGDMDHGGHDMPPIAPPGSTASAEDIATYLDQLFALGETHVHDMTSDKVGEHMAAMDLVPRDASTHVAIGDGDWFDPYIWANGEVPGDDARVLIPEGVTVSYGDVSAARLFTVRVDGTLDFATDTSSQIVFDTFVVSPSGHLIIGTETDPVDPNVDINLIVANNGPINTVWDPLLLSRGLISHGETTIHGAVKDSHEKAETDPMAGDTSIKFAGVPEGWQVGDNIVIAGTYYEGYKWDNEIKDGRHYASEDEVRLITAIDNDGTVHFETPLEHDHDTPREDLKTSVANYTRNVSIETENADEAEVYERGHVMFMHSDNVDVRYMEFHELGRTDKSLESRDVSDFAETSFDSNVQGRYSLHLHRTGTSDLENPAILEGNAVYGSPGWGIVHHDSNALLTNNATFDTFGAGYVAETGNETGLWTDNIAIFAQGISWDIPKNASELVGNFDTANSGDGFWFQGRLVGSVDNVAASVNHGFVYFHRDGREGGESMIDFDASAFAYPDALYNDTEVTADDAPILVFQNNETFAAREGLHVVKANTAQGHDISSHLDGFTAWSVRSGAHFQYTSHYILTDFDLIAKEDTPFSEAQDGISFGPNTSDVTIIDATISGFNTGIDLLKDWIDDSNDPALHKFTVIDADITDVNTVYGNYDPALDTITTRDALPYNDPDLNLDGPLVYTSTPTGAYAYFTGTKTDSLGTVEFPSGLDIFRMDHRDVISHLENDGYFTTSDGAIYYLVDIYFTDRVTGEIFYETHPVEIDEGIAFKIGNEATAYGGAIHNGVQDFTTKNGILYAGDSALDVAVAVPLPQVVTAPQTDAFMSMDSDMHSHATMADGLWLNGHDGDETLTLDIEGGYFINTGEMTNTDLSATGGDSVLATSGAEFDLGASRTLAIFDAAARVGFDGDDGGMAILDMHEGGTLAYSAQSGDLGTIEEFESPAYPGALDIRSGIDLGSTTLDIDLTGLSAEAGTEFTLMDADELVGAFNDPAVGGLGARDATIVVDYLNDSVTLKLSAGTGFVTVETLGEESDATAGEEDLWAALTTDQGLAEDQPLPEENEIFDAVA